MGGLLNSWLLFVIFDKDVNKSTYCACETIFNYEQMLIERFCFTFKPPNHSGNPRISCLVLYTINPNSAC